MTTNQTKEREERFDEKFPGYSTPVKERFLSHLESEVARAIEEERARIAREIEELPVSHITSFSNNSGVLDCVLKDRVLDLLSPKE